MTCPNCDRPMHTLTGGVCGCTWSEIVAARRLAERRRRDAGGRVVVDHQRSSSADERQE